MIKPNLPIHPSITSKTSVRLRGGLRSALALAALSSALVAASPRATAGPPSKEPDKAVVEPEKPAGFPIHALLNLEFSDHYITPRGLNVENQGLIFQPLFLLFYNPYSNPKGFVNDVTITTGVWNSVHTRKSGREADNFNETDPIAGLSVKFAKQLQFDVFYSAFFSQTDSYETSQNLSLKLTWNDKFFGSFAINPYVEYWRELSDKATVVFNPATSNESYYFSLGIIPTYKFKTIPLELAFPTYVNLCGKDFYQRFDGSGGGSGLAVFSTQIKATVPLKFIPKKLGFWSIYAGFQYYNLSNDGVLDGNQVLGADAERERNLYQIHGGLSIFF